MAKHNLKSKESVSINGENSSSEDLVGINEASKLVGVSEETIKQYTKLGVLKNSGTGENLGFTVSDLETTFHVQIPQQSPKNVKKAKPSKSSAQTKTKKQPRVSSKVKNTPSKQQEEKQTAKPGKQTSSENIGELEDNISIFPSPSRISTENTQHSNKQKIQSTSNNELIQSLQAQIEIIKDERDWLRRRLESLEQQNERTQMLLLSKSETVRKLVEDKNALNSNKKTGIISYFFGK